MFTEIKINGRSRHFRRITSVKQTGKGRYIIETRHNGTYTAEGGRSRGGKHTDWFLDGPAFPGGSIDCKGLLDACNVLEGM